MKLSFDTSGNPKQKEAAQAWINPEIKDIVFGGAKGGGKSWLGCNLIFGNALIYPGTRYFIARKNLNDLVKHTIPTIDKVFKSWGIDIDKYAKFNAQKNIYNLSNGSTVLLIYAKEIPSDPLYERFGSMEMTQGWIEEAGEFDFNAMSNLSISIGRHMNDKYGLVGKLLQTCNPKKNYLYTDYYTPWKSGKLHPSKKFIQAFVTDNKKNEADYINRLYRTLTGVAKERLLDGVWEYATDSDALCDYDKICDIFSNTHVNGGQRCITSDIARLGGDRIVVIEWDGWRGKVKEIPPGTLPQTATSIEAARYRNQCGKHDVVIDSDGLGVGISDFVGYIGFVNGSSPLPDPMKPYNEDGKEITEQFDMLKSQCYFRLAERINKNGLYLECESEEQEELIKQELAQIRQKEMDSDKKKGVLPKHKVKQILNRSPDFADTIMMREYFELKPKKIFADANY